MITGIYEPTQGSIAVSGKISSLLELGTGFNLEYTGIENIFFYGTLMGRSRSQMEDRLQEIIDFADIGDYVYQPVKTYSSGMFARLAFSCAVNVEPDILIVDEILSVGDMRFQAKCFNKFKEFRSRGVTILYVGHDISTMRTFCDTAMWINKGKLVDIGDPTFISAKYTEFMYVDDNSTFTEYKLLDFGRRQKDSEDDIAKKEASIEQCSGEPQMQSSKISGSLFPDSIAHWGTRTGMVRSARMYNIHGMQKNIFQADEMIRIEILFDVPDDIDMEFFSVAFSMKNTEGTDVIVKTTFDEKCKLQTGKDQKIDFSFTSGLANGEYYLVIALENRKNASITYYEYIEGACYFKMYTARKIFGIYDVYCNIDYGKR